MLKLMVIDNDRKFLHSVQMAFDAAAWQVVIISDASNGVAQVQAEVPDVLLLGITLSGARGGLAMAREVRKIDPSLPVIFAASAVGSESAIEAMKLGAYDILQKPVSMHRVLKLAHQAAATRCLMMAPKLPCSQALSPAMDSNPLLGRSAVMVDVYKQIGRVTAHDIAVLIRGENGTGKELVARAIYQHSQRREKHYLAVNCAALSETLLESELFGHEKGAFTGAHCRHIGKFEQCHGGTILLDEIGDMSATTQAKVLRVLEEHKLERVGGSETIDVDVRVIAATNRDLEHMIKEKIFRVDLLHRLDGYQIFLPPLRDRQGDLELLCQYFVRLFNRQLNKDIDGFAPATFERFQQYGWPGNIRELHNVIQKSMLMTFGPIIESDSLPNDLSTSWPVSADYLEVESNMQRNANVAQLIDERIVGDTTGLYDGMVTEMEGYLIRKALQHHHGNQTLAAKQLGITRGNLRKKVQSLGLSIGQVVSHALV